MARVLTIQHFMYTDEEMELNKLHFQNRWDEYEKLKSSILNDSNIIEQRIIGDKMSHLVLGGAFRIDHDKHGRISNIVWRRHDNLSKEEMQALKARLDELN
jgi:S-adenosylmethionine:tRNA-ribosyltransferase-isomerase (queuine synthetase)